MKILNDFALKEDYKRLQPVGDKLAEIDSLIDCKSVRIIFESIYFNKTFPRDGYKAYLIIIFKMLFLQHLNGLSDFELQK